MKDMKKSHRFAGPVLVLALGWIVGQSPSAHANPCCQFAGPPITCNTMDEEDCMAAGGSPYGNLGCNTTTNQCDGGKNAPVPAASTWGLIILTLSLLIAATLLFARGRRMVQIT